MKIRLRIGAVPVIFILVLFLVFAGCATVGPPGSRNDTLLIIPLRNKVEHSNDVFGHYAIVIRCYDTERRVKRVPLPTDREFAFVRGLPPGRYYISESHFIRSRDKTRHSRREYPPARLPFVLEPGSLSVSPALFGTQLDKNDRGQNVMRIVFEPLEPYRQTEVYADAVEEFPTELSAWTVAAGLGALPFEFSLSTPQDYTFAFSTFPAAYPGGQESRYGVLTGSRSLAWSETERYTLHPLSIHSVTDSTIHFRYAGDNLSWFRLEESVHPGSWTVLEETVAPGPDGRFVISRGRLPVRYFRLYRVRPQDASPEFDYLEAGYAFYSERWLDHKLPSGLIPFEGDEIVFLARKDWLAEGQFDLHRMAAFVSLLDAGWRVFEDLVIRLPRPSNQINGKGTIAALPRREYDLLDGAYARGRSGATGIEDTGFYERTWPLFLEDPLMFETHYFYEMGRNYYLFRDRHSLFATGFAIFMRYVCIDLLDLRTTRPQRRRTVETLETEYAASDKDWFQIFVEDWETQRETSRPQKFGYYPSDLSSIYASIMLRLAGEYGTDWIREFYRQLFTCPEGDPSTTEGQILQALNMVVSASLAAGEDLTPLFINRWKFPLDEATVTALGTVAWADARVSGYTAGELLPGVQPAQEPALAP
jgi:hypothetical protein